MSQSWEHRLHDIYELMRDMSQRTDPQDMATAYGQRVMKINPIDRRLSLSRRELASPEFRITRDSSWTESINPWKEKHRLPKLRGGLLADLIYEGRPLIIDDLAVPGDDPSSPILAGYRSLMAIPMLDHGESLNMVILLQRAANAFDRERFPETFWTANLFGRATQNLVLRDEVKEAYEAVDRELKIVGRIQRSLLPVETPKIESLELAADYRTSRRAGGDYYDFFPLADGRWGILVADVSGHGTPAAVMMAITHSIAHLYPNDAGNPRELLEFVNQHLTGRYTLGMETFVTAFYGIFDSKTRRLTYASAGHNPPRWWKAAEGRTLDINGNSGPPLGIDESVSYPDNTVTLAPGDRVIFYTDGISEAMNDAGDMFRVDRIDEVLAEHATLSSAEIRDRLLARIHDFTGGSSPNDDRTLVVASVT
jgi:sigma-B regulation protein RsbU (phosphoserine phosphatase)